jgi:hypothetical protein
MTFTSDERWLLMLYSEGTLDDTADTLRLALRDIADPDERAAADGALRKLGGMDEASFQGLISESGGSYSG